MNKPWSKADIHIHTVHSDGAASVSAVLDHVRKHTDLRIIAITDHDTITGALEAQRLAPSYGLEVIVGEEVSTADGHMLALFIEQPLAPGRPAAETIAAAHAQGGLCIPAHPYGWRVPSMGYARLRDRCVGPACDLPIDAIETFNASLWLPYCNKLAANVATELNLPTCGGSDSHHLATIGLGYTLFPGDTAEDLRHAIQTGQVRAGGTSWGFVRNIEFISLWLFTQTQRAFRLSTPSVTARFRRR